MTAPWPSVDPRRRAEFRARLQAHARAVLGGAEPSAGPDDWLAALLEIVARMESEVSRRLDRTPEKQQRNFAAWLGVKPRPARAARLAAVFRSAAGAAALTTPRGIKLQSPPGAIFETEEDLTILPGAIKVMTAVAGDRIMLPPPGLFDPAVPPPQPVRRELISLASRGAEQLQVAPALGLAPDGLVRVGGGEYRIVELKGDLVKIDPPLEADAPEGSDIVQVSVFAPVFAGAGGSGGASTLHCCMDGRSVPVAFKLSPDPVASGGTGDVGAPRDWQLHELYIGDDQALDIATAASIRIDADPPLTGVTWAYYGKAKDDDTPKWRTLAAPPTTPDTLAKPEGSIEPFERGGVKTRWLRAGSTAGRTLPMRGIRIAASSDAPVAFEAVANAAPISSAQDFFPLGAEPRLFDSFYLGCAEAFSKAAAEVTVSITVPTATLGPIAAAPVTAGQDALFFSIGDDGMLYRIVQPAGGDALVWSNLSRPPQTQLAGDAAPGVAIYQGAPAVAAPVKDQGDIWLWRNDAWTALGEATADPPPSQPAAAVLLRVAGQNLEALALRDGRLFEATIVQAGQPVAPVLWGEVDLGGQIANALVGYWADTAPPAAVGGPPGPMTVVRTGTKLTALTGVGAGAIRTDITPANIDLVSAAGLNFGASGQAYGGVSATNQLVAFANPANASSVPAIGSSVDLAGRQPLHPPTLAVPAASTDFLVLLVTEMAGTRNLAVWQPAVSEAITYLGILEGSHRVSQAAVPIGPAPGPLTPPPMVLAGDRADLAGLDVTGVPFTIAGAMTDRVRLDPPAGFALIELSDGTNRSYALPAMGQTFVDAAGTQLLVLPGGNLNLAGPAITWRSFDRLDAMLGTLLGTLFVPALPSGEFQPQAGATAPQQGDIIDVQGVQHLVLSSVDATHPNASLDPPLTGTNGDAVHYTHFRQSAQGNAQIRPAIDLTGDPAQAQAAGDAGVLYAPGANPPLQRVLHNVAGYLLLGQAWTTPPVASGGQFAFQLPPTGLSATWQTYNVPANPALSWEYWNGTGWWALNLSSETTGNLRRGGHIAFTVPDDLKPTDVIGKINHWIRARLVGGDYGHETFTLTNSPGATTGTTVQSIERNTDTVRPPRIAELTIKYIGAAVTPGHVITHDNLGWRNQSDANRTVGAVMAVFQTFRDSLAAAAPAPPPSSGSGEDPYACREAPAAAAEEQDAVPDAALYIGLDTPVLPGSVRLLFTVDDQPASRTLVVETLRDGVFADAAPTDATDGLAQSGMLTLAPEHPTAPAVLFGQTLHWIRVSLGPSAPRGWPPVIRGLYLNAAWAAAAETQKPEILGSSDGAPLQTHTLVRTPVLPGSLVLRVRETLDEEQIAELRAGGADAVVVDPPGFPSGAWVLWREVPDPLDEPAGARVYGLDAATGEVGFGDAGHGLPPPVGVDNIAAFAYRRGGGAAANEVRAGQALQPVSPLTGVEAVIVGAAAAGGADVASAETTLERAAPSLWSRDRALTLRDLEQLALGSAPEIVQARCETLRGGRVRLVAVVDGADPRPGRRTCAELEAYLAARAGPILQGGKLDVEAPALRPLKLELELIVADTDHTGEVAAAVKTALKTLFDPVSGGFDKRGWPLGAVPADADIAAALIDVEGVLAVGAIRRLNADGGAFPDRLPLKALVSFAPEDLVIDWQADT